MDDEEFEEETEELFSSREKHLLVRLREARNDVLSSFFPILQKLTKFRELGIHEQTDLVEL